MNCCSTEWWQREFCPASNRNSESSLEGAVSHAEQDVASGIVFQGHFAPEMIRCHSWRTPVVVQILRNIEGSASSDHSVPASTAYIQRSEIVGVLCGTVLPQTPCAAGQQCDVDPSSLFEADLHALSTLGDEGADASGHQAGNLRVKSWAAVVPVDLGGELCQDETGPAARHNT